jgi:hypothetical protein
MEQDLGPDDRFANAVATAIGHELRAARTAYIVCGRSAKEK